LKNDLENVREIQKQLIGDMIGPLSKKEIKKRVFYKYLINPKIPLTEKQG